MQQQRYKNNMFYARDRESPFPILFRQVGRISLLRSLRTTAPREKKKVDNRVVDA